MFFASINGVIDKEGANIDSGFIRSHVDGKSEFELVIQVSDVVHLFRIVGMLRKVDSVFEVTRSTVSTHAE